MDLSNLISKPKEFIEKANSLPVESIITARNPHGEFLQHLAVRSDSLELLKYLDGKGCYLNAVDYRGASVLYHASISDAKNCINYLIERKIDPRPISSFSGERAVGVAKDEKTKELLEKYTTKFEKILDNPYLAYQYRMAIHWRTSLEVLTHPNGSNFYGGYPIHIMAKITYNNKFAGLPKLIESCKSQDSRYETYLNDEKPDISLLKNLKQCLVCECETKDVCKYCKKARICNECFGNKNPVVIQYLQLHTGCDCKRFQK